MGWKGKMLVAAFGLVVLLAGISLVAKPAVDWIITVAMITSAVLLYGLVGWKMLLNGKYESGDLVQGITLGLAILMTVAAISSIAFFQFSLPAWISTVAAYGTILVGIWVLFLGLFTNMTDQ